MRTIRFVVAVALLSAGAAALPAGTGRAHEAAVPPIPPPLSFGCSSLNSPFLDQTYFESIITDVQFFAGETASFRVGPPTGTGTAPTESQLLVNGAVVASAGFPAALSYEVPADGIYTIEWLVGPNPDPDRIEHVGTWRVTCGPPGIGSSDGGDLADTGPASSTVAVVAGALFVAAGSSLFLVSRKRQRTTKA